MIHCGIDEAGYGPTLGPLLLTRSAFEFAEKPSTNLWTCLDPAVRHTRKGSKISVWVDDSKIIKNVKNGLELLELGVLAFACTVAEWPETFGAFLDSVGVPASNFQSLPWYDSLLDKKLPLHAWKGDILDKSQRLKSTFDKVGIHFRGFQSKVIVARDFNEGIDRTDNKATFHMESVSDLVKGCAQIEPKDKALSIVCDKLGGRDRYSPLLGQSFPGRPIVIHKQGGKLSHYTVELMLRNAELRFMQKADSKSLAAALSSMLCKYVREAAMASFNDYFQKLQPGLKKTAGYPQDAKRFLRDIEALIPELEAPPEWLIRCR